MLPQDFLEITTVEDPQIAPDGGSILYVRCTFDLESNKTRRAIWRVQNGVSRPFTQGIADRAPRWSPRGDTIAFLRANDEKKSDLYLIAADGGEPRRLAGPFARVGPAAWSPDGTRLAFSAAGESDSYDTTVAFDEESGARHVTALPYKSDANGLFDGKRMQIHVVTLDGDDKIIAKGAFDAGNPAWSPDGTTLAFVANPGVKEGSFANDLYVTNVRGGQLRRLTEMNGIFGAPAYSRDGKEIAVVGLDTDEFSGRRNAQLWCIPAGGGAPRSLTPDRTYALGDALMSDLRSHDDAAPYWTPDDREIVIQRSHQAVCTLYAYARDGGGSRELIAGEHEVFAFTGARDGTIVFASTGVGDPCSLALLRGSKVERLPNENAQWLATHRPAVPERIRPVASDGTVLDAWIIRAKPSNGATPPLVHAVHGGPHAAYGCVYFFEFQLLASLGMHVVYGNPRGSQSYGEAYADAITGKWGDLDASDLKTILEDAKAKLGVQDPRKIAVQGGSYGGLMTTWLLGHSKDYACGVSMRAVNDYHSEALASDIPKFLERELAVDWSDGGRRLFEMSPIRGASNIDAPLLVIHSERDFRCPIDQGEQLFSLLRQLGKDAEFVRFTGDGHDLSRTGSPRNRLLRYRALVHWLRVHLGLERSERGAGWLFAPLEGEAPSEGGKKNGAVAHDGATVAASP